MSVLTSLHLMQHAAQQHELNLTRHYESLLLNRESQTLSQDLSLTSSQSDSLARLAHLVRMSLRSLAGEDPESSSSVSSSGYLHPEKESEEERDRVEGYREGGYSGTPPPLEDWALEREIEVTRLEKENEELRRLLAISTGEESISLSSSFSLNGGSDGGMWDSVPRMSGSGAGPMRRGLLSQNRARMMGGGGRGAGGQVAGQGMQGVGQGMVGGAGGSGFIIGSQTQWGQQESAQKKAGSYFKEFPT